MSFDIPPGFSVTPCDTTRIFGRKLAAGTMNGEESIRSLSEMLMDVRCDPLSINQDLSLLEIELGDSHVSRFSPFFVPLAKIATRGILLRDNDQDLPPEPPESFDAVLANTTEGVLWESETGKAYRERITTEIAGLLRHLMSGFQEGGVTKKDARSVVRSEIEAGLDDVATRITSYAAMNYILVSSTILRKAGLASPATRFREVKRVAVNLAKNR